MQLTERIKESRMHSLIYTLGTALAVCFVMILSITGYLALMPIYPETNRWDTYKIWSMKIKWSGGQEESYNLTSWTWYELLSQVKAVDNIALVGYPSRLRYITADGKYDKEMTMRNLSPNAFKIYDFDFVAGRPFTWDEVENNKAGAIITEDAAKALFGNAEQVVRDVKSGKEVTIQSTNDYNYTTKVVGVVKTPSKFARKICADIYMPTNNRKWGEYLLSRDINYSDGDYWQDLPSQLNPFVHQASYNAYFVGTAEQAKAVQHEIDSLVTALNQKWAADGVDGEMSYPHRDKMNDDDKNRVAWLVIFFLSVALVPVMSLVTLVDWRMAGRRAEVSVRRAFGATRLTLLKEILWENLLLTCIGGVIGLALAWWYVAQSQWLLKMASDTNSDSPSVIDIPLEAVLSPWMFVDVFVLCVVINLASALLPAWRMLRKADVGVGETSGSRHTMFVPGPFRPMELWHNKLELLKVAVIAFACWLMVGVGSEFLMKRYSPQRFDTTHYALMDITQDATLLDDEMTNWELNPHALAEKARQLPEVEEATIAYEYRIPGSIQSYHNFVIDSLNVPCFYGGECFFITGTRFCETVGLKPVEGSPSFDEMEAAEAEFPCILSRSAAMSAFGTTDVVGRALWEQASEGTIIRGHLTVVGVVEDAAMNNKHSNRNVVYCPMKNYSFILRLLLRLKDDCDVEQFCERYNQQERSERISHDTHVGINALPMSAYCKLQGNDHAAPIIYTLMAFLLLCLLLGSVSNFWIRTHGMRGYIGVMRAFGASKRRIVMGLLAEGWVICIAGFALAAVVLAVWLYKDWDEDFLDIIIHGTPSIILLIVTASVGIIIPAWMATRENINDSINQE